MLKKIKKALLSLAASGLLLTGISTWQAAPVAAATANYQQQDLKLDVKAAIAVDADSGQILYAKNATTPRQIASMTKLVTVYLTLQAIKQGKLSWTSTAKPTAAIAKISQNTEYSNVPLTSSHAYTIKELYRATLIESANGAAMTLAQAVSGDQVTFVKKMRKLLTSWGIKDAKIYNACGLANGNLGSAAYPGVGKDVENEMSATDMAIVCQKLLKDFPEVLQTTSITSATFSSGSTQSQMTNWNWMLKGLNSYYSDLPVDGLKTGTTDKAGACFAGTVKKNGHRIITVVLGAKHANSQDPSRFVQTAKLMHYVYQNYTAVTLKKGSSISGANTVKVPEGKETSSKVVLDKTVTIWAKQGSKLQTSLSKTTVSAPVKKGSKVASYKFSATSGKLPSLSGKTVTAPAVATQDNQEANFFVRLWRSIFGSK